MTGVTEVAYPPNRREPGPATTLSMPSRDGKPICPPSLEGPAIPNDRFWFRRRPTRDAPRSLQQLLQEVEKSTQVRRSGLERVLTELQQHRDSASDAGLREALTWLCNSVTRMISNPTAAHSREVLIAADAVKRA